MHILTSKYAGTIYHSKLCKNLVTPTSTHATQIKQPRKKKSSTNQRAGFISQIASGRIDKCVQPIVKKRLIIIYIVIMKITQDGLKNPDKLYIVVAECLMSCTISLSVSILFLFRHSDTWMSLSILGISWSIIISTNSVVNMWSVCGRVPSGVQYE